MKYSEFEAIAKENGWRLDMDEVIDKWVYVSKNGFEIVISQFEQNYFDLRAKKGCVIDLIEEKEFIEACYELVETPVEDREDEKKYYLKHKFIKSDFGVDGYLSKITHTSDYELNGISFRLDTARDKLRHNGDTHYQAAFTADEIEEIKKLLNTNLEDFELIIALSL